MKAALAIARRDLVRWFTNPTGYVFITVFIALGAAAQFLQERFFANNLANLAPLNELFPYILLFFAPAVAMGTWADERRHGTDELLLTLPTKDASLVAGKYLAALGVYAVALAFSLGYVAVLRFLGRPDAGLMFGTYFGYFLLGAGLLAIAMIGSLLTESVTVGFLLGAVFCSVPVFTGDAAGFLGEAVASAGVREAFRDFTEGVVSLSGLVYFGVLTAFGLVVNLYLLRRRRLRGEEWHLPVRAACLVVSGAALCVLAGRTGARIDVTAERLHSLAPQTGEALAAIPADKPVFIQAYVSPEVPRDYVEIRESLLSLLRGIDSRGGDRVHVKVSETVKSSDAAREAEEKFKIKPVRLSSAEGGRRMDVFLAAAVTCGLDEVVVPFFYKGISAEYELTRSIRVVSQARRRKIGILTTDAKWFGGFEFSTMQPSPTWTIVEELRRQYEVVQVAPDAPITESMDALIVPLPSSLPQAQMDHLAAYVKQGKPVLLLDDPLPIFNPSIGANEAMRGGRRGMMGGSPPEPKGNVRDFYRAIGVDWEPSDIVWDTYSPHPSLGDFPPEVVFVGRGAGGVEPFNPLSSITTGLQEIVLLFGGRVRSAEVKGIGYTPLVRTGRSAGVLSFSQVWMSNPFFGSGGLNQTRRHVPPSVPEEPAVAARVEGAAGDVKVNAIVVCDVDLASEQFFELRRQGLENLTFDNVTFILNCVDALAGDEAMIALRTRRPRHRTLEAVEERTREHERKRMDEARAAEERAEKQRSEAQGRFDDAVKKIESRTDVDAQTKEIMAQSVREVEQRRLDVEKRRIDDEKDAATARSEAERDRRVGAIRNGIRWAAILLPPVPALAIALIALYFRIRRELEAHR
jgi:ABC-2 type transport system permease protein